jgi:ATP adenylyltransferase
MSFSTEPTSPYNLLLTRDWLLVVPRSQEKIDDVSVNALGFAGSLFVRRKEQIEQLRAYGPLALLAAVAQQRP